MTCVDKYLKEHPGEQIVGCPHQYGYLEKPSNCMDISCFKDCWARKLPEDDRKENVE